MKTFWQVFVYGALALLVIGFASICPNARAASTDHFPNVCAQLRSGASLRDIETSLLTAGYDDAAAGTFAGKTIRDHCPEQVANVLRQMHGT